MSKNIKPLKGKSKVTTKKTKVIGTQQYVNPNTGELEDFNVISIEERDYNFHKMWLTTLISQLEEMTNKKTKVAFHLLEKMSKKDNSIWITYDDIIKDLNVSRQTVADTFKILKEADFLREQGKSFYVINPETVFYGGKNKRDNILIRYGQIDNPERDDYIELKKLKDTRTHELKKLKREELLLLLGQTQESPVTLKMKNDVLISMIVDDEFTKGGEANEEDLDTSSKTS